MSAVVTSIGVHEPRYIDCFFCTSTRSTNRSSTSAPVAVIPHAMRWLWPSATNGTPGIVTPITSSPPATRCISYQVDGNSICRCGSLARIGLPLFVLLPAITQLLLLPRRAPDASHSSPRGIWRGMNDADAVCDVFGASRIAGEDEE